MHAIATDHLSGMAKTLLRQANQGAGAVVSTRRVKHAGRFPLTAGVMARLAYAHAKKSGVHLAPLLNKVGLTRQQIADRDAPMTARDQIEFLDLVAQALDDDLLGFHLAQQCDLREGGLYYYVIASSGTFLDAFRRAARYSSIVNEGVAQECIQGKEIAARFRYTGVSRYRDWHQIEFWATAMVRMFRQLTGVQLAPSHLHLVHKRKRGAAELLRFFGSRVKFEAAVDEIAFATGLGDLPLVKADPHLNRLLVTYSEEAISHRGKKRGSIRSKVENAIFPLLPHDKIRVGHVARQLGMSQRSLARHLAHEGLNFSTVLNELRLDLARRYMKDEQLSVSHVAWLLGYQSVASFSHAFKRWTGNAPSDALRRR
jgi:AraC-like DNA-binding protein